MGSYFYAAAKLNLPSYLEKKVLFFVQKLATKRDKNVSFIVNQLLRGDMQIAEMME